MFNPQKHSEERVTKTKLKFNKFNLSLADWEFHEDKAIFEENFYSMIIQNILNINMFYIEHIKYYKKLAKQKWI